MSESRQGVTLSQIGPFTLNLSDRLLFHNVPIVLFAFEGPFQNFQEAIILKTIQCFADYFNNAAPVIILVLFHYIYVLVGVLYRVEAVED